MRKWDLDEIEYLKGNYYNKLDFKIAEKLSRSLYSIKRKANYLGLRKSNNFWKRKHRRSSERMTYSHTLKGRVS